MSEAWVINASPLILLSRIDRLDLIERLAPAILIPHAVIDEVRAGQDQDQTAAAALKWVEHGEKTIGNGNPRPRDPRRTQAPEAWP